MNKILLIEGDGIGHEITKSLVTIFKELNFPYEFEIHQAGAEYYEKTGELISEKTLEALKKYKVAIKGPLTTPIGTGFRSINVMLRKKFDLYANIRPIKSLLPESKFKVDLIIFRENTEDLYAGLEEMINEDEAKSIKIITRKASERIIQKAFQYANKQNINKVTIVTKANIMKYTDGLFLECGRKINKMYPHIELEEVLVDNMSMQLVMNPENYQVIVTENLYGDILSDLAAGLVGGLGLVPGANIGDDIAVFEPAHGSAPDIAGKNLANPTALLLSAVEMLRFLGDHEREVQLREAIFSCLKNQNTRTKDLHGELSTADFTKTIIKEYLKSN